MIERLSSSKRSLRPRFQTWWAAASAAAKLRLSRALVALCAIALAACNEQILHDLSESEANKVVSRLSAAALDARKVQQSDGRWAISVPSDAIVPALAFLDSNRVLVSRVSHGAGNQKSGFVPSREEQWFRYERSISYSLEESLAALAGVLEARVHLNLPETDPLFGTKKEGMGSGSVLLLVDSRYSASNDEISALVAGAAGLEPKQITVLRSVAPQDGSALRDAQSNSIEEEGDGHIAVAEPEEQAPRAQVLAMGAAGFTLCAVVWAQLCNRRRPERVRFRRLDQRDGEE